MLLPQIRLINGGQSSVHSMGIKRPLLVNNEIYHIILRGVGDALIFKDESDYYRAIFSVYEFNTTTPIEIRERRKIRAKIKASGGLSSDTRDKLVEVLCFCLMPNHIHLLVRQLKDNGITQFMRKVGTGYATYFNKKYNRKGHLFQNRFQAVHIKNDDQLKIVFAYIHTNPISLIEPGWKENGIQDPNKVIEFLENYKWSSYLDYIGKKAFPSVTERSFIIETMGGEQGCKEFVNNIWINYKSKTSEFTDLFLE